MQIMVGILPPLREVVKLNGVQNTYNFKFLYDLEVNTQPQLPAVRSRHSTHALSSSVFPMNTKKVLDRDIT